MRTGRSAVEVLLDERRRAGRLCQRPARHGALVLTFTPAGIERWFEETLERAPNDVRDEDVPDNVDEVAARYVATAHRYGIEFV